jgi:hypothetical protein
VWYPIVVITGSDIPRPLVLLDIDGVVNDILSSMGIERPWPERRVPMGEIELAIPLHVPPLLEYIDLITEIRWCTTWGDLANLLLPDLIGIGPYPIVGAGDPAPGLEWKARSARPVAEDALGAGRAVFWIEDFEGELPMERMPAGVTYVDTAARGEYVLLPHHLPPELLPGGLRNLSDTPGAPDP